MGEKIEFDTTVNLDCDNKVIYTPPHVPVLVGWRYHVTLEPIELKPEPCSYCGNKHF